MGDSSVSQGRFLKQSSIGLAGLSTAPFFLQSYEGKLDKQKLNVIIIFALHGNDSTPLSFYAGIFKS